jgi:hypothetical protein
MEKKKDNATSFWIHQIKDSKYQTATENKNNYTSYFRWDNRRYIQTNEKLKIFSGEWDQRKQKKK